ncbi:MAG: N-acetyltransferase [Erythrobacter sp.]
MSAITIRPEQAGDEAAIHALTDAAFREAPHSDGSEAKIVDRLRADGDLTLSLVAEDAARIVGHVALSPATISDGSEGWFGLGPISVWPELQRAGIGFRLMKRAIADMRERGAKGIVLLGDPAYYARFGFEHDPELAYPGPPAEYFQRLVLEGDPPRGEVAYAPAFG